MNTLVAIPSKTSDGLEAIREEYFEKCACFTLIFLEKSRIAEVAVVNNIYRQNSEHTETVQLLLQKGVKILISGIMEIKSVISLNRSGIEIYYGGASKTVHETLDAFVKEQLTPLDHVLACQSGK